MTVSILDMPTYPSILIFDTAADPPVIGIDANHSIIVPAPSYIHLASITLGEGEEEGDTYITVEGSVHKDAGFSLLLQFLSEPATTPVMISLSSSLFAHAPNFVRVVKHGTGDVKVYAQLTS